MGTAAQKRRLIMDQKVMWKDIVAYLGFSLKKTVVVKAHLMLADEKINAGEWTMNKKEIKEFADEISKRLKVGLRILNAAKMRDAAWVTQLLFREDIKHKNKISNRNHIICFFEEIITVRRHQDDDDGGDEATEGREQAEEESLVAPSDIDANEKEMELEDQKALYKFEYDEETKELRCYPYP